MIYDQLPKLIGDQFDQRSSVHWKTGPKYLYCIVYRYGTHCFQVSHLHCIVMYVWFQEVLWHNVDRNFFHIIWWQHVPLWIRAHFIRAYLTHVELGCPLLRVW